MQLNALIEKLDSGILDVAVKPPTMSLASSGNMVFLSYWVVKRMYRWLPSNSFQIALCNLGWNRLSKRVWIVAAVSGVLLCSLTVFNTNALITTSCVFMFVLFCIATTPTPGQEPPLLARMGVLACLKFLATAGIDCLGMLVPVSTLASGVDTLAVEVPMGGVERPPASS